MRFALALLWMGFLVFASGGCGIYTPYGAQTSGARTFSVDYFRPQSPLASPAVAQNFTESLKDVIQRQSTLRLVDANGELSYAGQITDYRVSPVGVQADETTARNRLSVTVQVRYTNTLDQDLNFERSFTKFADFDSNLDLLAVEEELMAEISEQLIQEIFNASLGNW
ncbi:MAG: LptE family protein [Flavobacteriales bacterium]